MARPGWSPRICRPRRRSSATQSFVFQSQNLERNPHHYSFIASLGPSILTAIAERIGAGVYFNSMVPLHHRLLMKYGVIGMEPLIADLTTWNSLYVAGRLHKPVRNLQLHPAVEAAQAANLEGALRTALLLLPPQFTTPQLLHTLCG